MSFPFPPKATPNVLRISFSGPAKCSLIFESLNYCPCPTCNSWTVLETQPFKDDPQRAYGIIELEGYDQVVSFEVCRDHEMLMKLIAYPDRQTASTSGLDMFVCGWKQNDRWTDNVVIKDSLCVVTIEVICVTTTLAFTPSPLLTYPVVTYRRRCPQLFADHPHRHEDKYDSDSDIKVEVNDHYHNQQSSTIKIEVDDFYRPRAMLSTIPKSMPTPKLAPVSEKQEIDCSQGQYTSSPAPIFPPWPLLSQDDSYHQCIYTPPPPTVKKDEKEIEWEQCSFPPPPLPPRPVHEENTVSIFSKSSKHGGALWRRFNARIRPRS